MNQSIEPQRYCDDSALLLTTVLALSISGLGASCPAQAEDMDLMETLIARSALLNNNLSPFEPRWERGPEGEHLSFGFGVEKKLSEDLVSSSTANGIGRRLVAGIRRAVLGISKPASHMSFYISRKADFSLRSHLRFPFQRIRSSAPIDRTLNPATPWLGEAD